MFGQERTIRPALAAIMVLCFLMPFVEITCSGQRVASITGIDMALGKTVKSQDMADMMAVPGGNDPRYESELAKPYEDTSHSETANQNEMAASQDPSSFPTSGPSKIEPQPTAAAAFIFGVLALIMAFAASRKFMIGSAVCAGLAAISLFVLKTRFSSELPSEVSMVVSIEWTPAFWVALIGAAALAIFTARSLSEKSRPINNPRLVIQSHADKPPSNVTFR
jgi:lysylphosphatidylglycerol synthetase-like protein (DUF2156 family)